MATQREVVISGMKPVRFIRIPDYDIMIATDTSFGQPLSVKLSEVIKKKLVSMQDDVINAKKCGLGRTVEGEPLTLTFLTAESGDDATRPVGLYYPANRPEGFRRLLIEVA